MQPVPPDDYEARYRKTGAPDWSPTWSFRDYGTPGFTGPPGSPAAPKSGDDAPLIHGLEANTEYQVEVRAINAIGESGWSNRVSATTAQATTANDDGTADADNGSGPAAAPSQPTVRRVANDPGLMVRWNAPRTTPSGFTLLAYDVEIEKERERDRRISVLNKRYIYRIFQGGETPPTHLLIPALEANTAYTVRVRAGYVKLTQRRLSPWSPDTSGTTAAGLAHDIQLSLEFSDGTRSTTVAPGAEVTYRVKATGIHDWAAVRARGGIGKAQIRIWEPERHKHHYFPYSYYRSTKGITYRHFIHLTGSSGYLEGAFTVPDEAGAGAYGTIEIQLVPPSSGCGGTGTGTGCSVGSTVGSVSSSTNKLCIAVDRSGTVAHPCSSGQTQAVAPTVEGTPGLSASGSDGSWTPGETVEAIVTFSEAVTVDTSSGTPAITLTLGGTLEQSARYTRGSGTKALVFVYTLIESDGSHTAMGVKPDSLALNGGSITSEASGADADLGHNGAIIMGERDGGTGPRGVRGVPQRSGPTASFRDLPATHDGKKPFTVKLSFSAEPRGLSYKTVRDSLLEVTGGTVTKALRVNDGSDREWKVTVAPSQAYAITLTLPPRACGETAAVCVGGRSLSRAASATIAGKALTASLTGPAEHDGSESFTVRLTFNTEPDVSYKTVRDTMFTEKGGAITGARRVKPPHDREFDIVVKPGGDAAVSFSLASPLPACGETGAVCTAGGRMLEGTASVSIPGPAALSVADAEVEEGADATLDFVVTLSRTRGQATTVQYATSDGTAIADADYTPKSGTLTFAAGEREKTVSVEILDDLHDDGGETMTLTLTNPVGARIADGAATGTITNSGRIPKAWLARFGRTVADQVLDAVDERMRGGSASTRMTLGGREVLMGAEWPKEGEALSTLTGAKGLGGAGDFLRGGVDPREGEHLFERKAADALASRAHSMSGLLLASSFHIASGEGEGKGESGRWSLWGRGARSSFSGRDGELALDGDVTTGLVGADYESGEALLGVALAWSAGDGSYKGAGAAGELESTLASVYPYLRYRMSERLSVWGVVGMGEGDLTLKTPTGETMETGLSLAMAALGVRGALLSRAGYELAVKSDFTFVRTESEKTTGLASAEAETRRLRLVLEGSREMDLGAGSLTPSVEVGLRYDGGDAETGAGVELGGGVRYAASGLTMEVRARGLLAHEESDYEEWGVSASVVFSPGSEGRGLSMRVGSAWGAASGGADRIWTGGAAGLAGGADQPGASLPGASLDAEVAYGLDAVRGLLTPYAGVALSENGEIWRAGARWKLGPAFDVSLEANLKEPVGDEEPEGGLLLRGSRRW